LIVEIANLPSRKRFQRRICFGGSRGKYRKLLKQSKINTAKKEEKGRERERKRTTASSCKWKACLYTC